MTAQQKDFVKACAILFCILVAGAIYYNTVILGQTTAQEQRESTAEVRRQREAQEQVSSPAGTVVDKERSGEGFFVKVQVSKEQYQQLRVGSKF